MIGFLADKRFPENQPLGALIRKTLIVVVAATACSTPADPNRPYAPMQENPYLQANEGRLNRETNSVNLDTIPRGIFLRMESTGGTLVKFANSEHIFRYILGSGTITQATAKEWAASGQEVDCRAVQFILMKSLELNQTQTEGVVSILATRTPVPSHARFALNAYESPDARRALILSADGPRQPGRPSLIFGLGGSGGGTRGVRYAQIFDIDRQQYLADAVALKSLAAEEPMFSFCFGPDERIVVAYETQRFNMASYFEVNFHIIETPR